MFFNFKNGALSCVTENDAKQAINAYNSVMADAPEEASQIAAIADAVVLNLGTLNSYRREAIRIAGKTAHTAGKPVVMDPVGVGASDFRRDAAQMLLNEAKPTVIRGNRSEIRALLTGETGERGVDTADLHDAGEETAQLLAKQTGAVVLQTGETDLVTDGEQMIRIHGGSSMLCLVTGAGCMLSALTGAFLAANPEQPLQAAASAAETMSVCAEIAQRRLRTGEGNASFRTRLIDAMCNLTPETFRKWRQEA